MQDWCAKLPGQMLRIAGVLALCDGKAQIDIDAMRRAAAITSWFTQSAAVVFNDEISDVGKLTGEFSALLLTRFLEECTFYSKGEYVKTADLLRCYEVWAEKHGYETPNPRRFVTALRGVLTVKKISEGNVARDIAI